MWIIIFFSGISEQPSPKLSECEEWCRLFHNLRGGQWSPGGRRGAAGASGEQHKSTAPTTVRTRNFSAPSRPAARAVEAWPEAGQSQTWAPTSSLPEPQAVPKASTLITFKKPSSNIFHQKLEFPKQPPRLAVLCLGFASANIHGVSGMWVTPAFPVQDCFWKAAHKLP